MSLLRKLFGATDTVWTGYVMRGSTDVIKRLIEKMRTVAPVLYYRVWQIFNQAPADQRELFEGALRVAVIPLDLLGQILPVGTEGKDLIRDMLGDVINEVRRNFIGAPEPKLAEGTPVPALAGEKDFAALAKEVTEFQPNWLKRVRSFVQRLADRIQAAKAGGEFPHHEFKQFRAAQLVLGPTYEQKFTALWQRGDSELLTQAERRWNLMESCEYLTQPEPIRVFLDKAATDQDIWLVQNNHDKWFNLPPGVIKSAKQGWAHLEHFGTAFGHVVGEMTKGLHRYNQAATARRRARVNDFYSPANMERKPDRWKYVQPGHPLWPERLRRERNRRIWIAVWIGAAVITGAAILAFATKHFLLGAVMSGLPVVILLAFLLAIFLDGRRRYEHA